MLLRVSRSFVDDPLDGIFARDLIASFIREGAAGPADRDGWCSPHTVVEVVSDDMPFLVDSVTMELGRQGHGIDLVIHPVIHVRRDQDGVLTDVLEHSASDAIPESILHAEVTRDADDEALETLKRNVERVLTEVKTAVEDWGAMRAPISKTAMLASGRLGRITRHCCDLRFARCSRRTD